MLVVEDDAFVREVVCAVLVEHGLLAIAADDGSQGIELLRTLAVDAVVSDVGMPGMSGFELTELLRLEHPRLPVVLITGRPSDDGARRAADVGAHSYLPKPFDMVHLVVVIQNLIRST